MPKVGQKKFAYTAAGKKSSSQVCQEEGKEGEEDLRLLMKYK